MATFKYSSKFQDYINFESTLAITNINIIDYNAIKTYPSYEIYL
jgi:hypothetical protein